MKCGIFTVLLLAALCSLCSCHDHMMRNHMTFQGFDNPGGPPSPVHNTHGRTPWQHKTSFQVSNGQQWTGPVRSDSFKATVNHDVLGGKNWGAGGYVTHERTNGFRDGNTHGGVRAHLNF